MRVAGPAPAELGRALVQGARRRPAARARSSTSRRGRSLGVASGAMALLDRQRRAPRRADRGERVVGRDVAGRWPVPTHPGAGARRHRALDRHEAGDLLVVEHRRARCPRGPHAPDGARRPRRAPRSDRATPSCALQRCRPRRRADRGSPGWSRRAAQLHVRPRLARCGHLAQAVPAPRRDAGGRRARRLAHRAAHERGDPRARPALRRRHRRAVDTDRLRPRAAAARPAPARRPLERPPPAVVRRRARGAARPGRRGHARAGALPRCLRTREPARRRRLGGRRAARLRRGVAAPGHDRVPRRAGRRALRPPRTAAPARLDAAAAAAARPLGPAAARLRRPRAHHPQRGPAAQADAQRRPDRHRRRPRGGELGTRARGLHGAASPSPRTSRSAAPRAPRSARRRSAPRGCASRTRSGSRGGGALGPTTAARGAACSVVSADSLRDEWSRSSVVRAGALPLIEARGVDVPGVLLDRKQGFCLGDAPFVDGWCARGQARRSPPPTWASSAGGIDTYEPNVEGQEIAIDRRYGSVGALRAHLAHRADRARSARRGPTTTSRRPPWSCGGRCGERRR